jgi:hypothetical protein
MNSAGCFSVGPATITRLPGRVTSLWTTFAAITVVFPHCREQFKMPRFASDRRISSCFSSGSNLRRVRANSTMSGSAV